MAKSYGRLRELYDTGRNGIWTFVLRNLTRPLGLSRPEQQTDVPLGNPPWIAYQHLSAEIRLRPPRRRHGPPRRRLTPSERRYPRATAALRAGPHRSGDIADQMSRKVTGGRTDPQCVDRQGHALQPGSRRHRVYGAVVRWVHETDMPELRYRSRVCRSRTHNRRSRITGRVSHREELRCAAKIRRRLARRGFLQDDPVLGFGAPPVLGCPALQCLNDVLADESAARAREPR